MEAKAVDRTEPVVLTAIADGVARVTLNRPRAFNAISAEVLERLQASLDAIAVGTPIVTLPGETLRGRQTAAMLRGIGIDDGIAADEAGYVAQAVAFTDGGARRAAASRLAAAAPALFDQPDSIAALGDLLWQRESA